MCLHTCFKTFALDLQKNSIGSLIGIMLDIDCLAYCDHFDNIDFPNPRTCYIFSSLCVTFDYFLIILEYKSFTSLGRFLVWYFILFDAIANGIVSLNSLYDLSLLLYRNTQRDFCVLILYLETLPNLREAVVTSFIFSMCNIMSSAKSDNFASSFPIWT